MAVKQCTARAWPALWRHFTTRPVRPLAPYRILDVSLHRSGAIQYMALRLSSTLQETNDSIQTTLNFKQPLSDLWNEYSARVESNGQLTEDDMIELCKLVKRDGSNTIEAIKRIQSILREIHHRKMDPEAFVRGCNMLMHLFIMHSDLKSARLVFDGMLRSNYRPNEVTVLTLVSGISVLGTSVDLHMFYQSLSEKKLWPETAETYRRLMVACAALGDIAGCRGYFSTVLRKRLPTDHSLYNTMLDIYSKADQMDSALVVYNQMLKRKVQPTSATFHIILKMLHKHERNEETMAIYEDLVNSKEEINASHYTAMGWDPKKALQEMSKLGIVPSTRDYNTFIYYYIKQNNFQDALEVLQTMQKSDVEPDVYSYALIMDTVVKDQEQPTQVVFDLYNEMKAAGVKPDATVYTSLIMACARDEDLDQVMKFLKEMKHNRVKPNIYTFNSILGLLARKTKPEQADVERAELLWTQLEHTGVFPDTRGFNLFMSLLSRFAPMVNEDDQEWATDGRDTIPLSSAEKRMLSLYREMRTSHRRDSRPDFATFTILINTLVAGGHIRQAMQVYNDAKMSRTPLSISAYNQIMKGLEKTNQMSQILNIWYDMKSLKVLPDSTTYSLALEACEQLGLSESFNTIRIQRKQDFKRLIQIDEKRAERLQNSQNTVK